MWSHYAKDHTGFCIEYDIGKLATQCSLRRGVFPVVYSSRFFDLTQWSERLMKAGRKRFNPAMVMLAMIHKYKDLELRERVAVHPDRTSSQPGPYNADAGTKSGVSRGENLGGGQD